MPRRSPDSGACWGPVSTVLLPLPKQTAERGCVCSSARMCMHVHTHGAQQRKAGLLVKRHLSSFLQDR